MLATALQPSPGYTIQEIPGQPVRLAPRTPGGVGIGISLKFYIIPPADRDPRDVASIRGVVLPSALFYCRAGMSMTYNPENGSPNGCTTPTKPYLRASSRARSVASVATMAKAIASPFVTSSPAVTLAASHSLPSQTARNSGVSEMTTTQSRMRSRDCNSLRRCRPEPLGHDAICSAEMLRKKRKEQRPS